MTEIKTKEEILSECEYISDGWRGGYEPSDVEKAMDLWAKQVALAFMHHYGRTWTNEIDFDKFYKEYQGKQP